MSLTQQQLQQLATVAAGIPQVTNDQDVNQKRKRDETIKPSSQAKKAMKMFKQTEYEASDSLQLHKAKNAMVNSVSSTMLSMDTETAMCLIGDITFLLQKYKIHNFRKKMEIAHDDATKTRLSLNISKTVEVMNTIGHETTQRKQGLHLDLGM